MYDEYLNISELYMECLDNVDYNVYTECVYWEL